jgi:hypothetical protein
VPISALALIVAVSTHAPGAPVQLSLRATFELQCGWPGPRVAVTLPAAERLTPRTAAKIDGRAPEAVTQAGDTITFVIARPSGVMCDAIGPGTVRIVLTGVRNPARAGRYAIRVRHGAETRSGAFSIR